MLTEWARKKVSRPCFLSTDPTMIVMKKKRRETEVKEDDRVKGPGKRGVGLSCFPCNFFCRSKRNWNSCTFGMRSARARKLSVISSFLPVTPFPSSSLKWISASSSFPSFFDVPCGNGEGKQLRLSNHEISSSETDP